MRGWDGMHHKRTKWDASQKDDMGCVMRGWDGMRHERMG